MTKENKTTAKSAKTLSFEDALARLNVIADTLENDAPSLEDALKLYEEGARLLADCTSLLAAAKAKITELAPVESGEDA